MISFILGALVGSVISMLISGLLAFTDDRYDLPPLPKDENDDGKS